MTPFEYVTVLISIILGLGITQIVTGVADMVHQWPRIKLYWPHVLWIVFVFFLHVEEWWVIYDLQKIETWELSRFLFVILYPISLFILARILFPFGSGEPATDFREFYFQNYKKFFIGVMVLALLALSENLLISHFKITEQFNQLILVAALGLIVVKNYRYEWLHKTIVIILYTVLLGSMVVRDLKIGPDAPKTPELATLVRQHFDALNKHDVNALVKLYSDSAQLESSGWEGRAKGHEAVREKYGRYFATSPDLKYTINNMVLDNGNSVVIEYTSSGTMVNLEKEVPDYMRGKPYTLKNSTRLEFLDGKVVKSVTFFDQLSFLQQMGFFDQPK